MLILTCFVAACSNGSEAGRETASAGSDAFEIVAVDDAGRTVSLASPARRIVSLLPAVTETIVRLGAMDRLVARTDYDDDPSLHHLPSVGGGLTPSLEVVAALEPDLVVVWEEAGTARVRPRLEALGVPVLALRTQDTTGIFANIDRVGRLLGLGPVADSLAGAIRSDLDDVRRSVAGERRPTALYMIGLDPPIVAGPSVFIGQVLEVAGGKNVFADVSAPSPQVSIEEIVRRRPEVILVPAEGSGADVVARLKRTPGWRDLLGTGGVRVEAIPVDLLHRPGPGIGAAARILREAIHRRGDP